MSGVAVAGFPWAVGPVNDQLSKVELALLLRMYADADGRGVLYSKPGRRHPSQRLLRALDSLGVIEFYDATAGGWERGMWGARLTCVGANAVFRDTARVIDEVRVDAHPGCDGGWLNAGTCSHCATKRPLDASAYSLYLHALDPDERRAQANGPQLFCVEHGWMRRADITTQKVCRLPGTNFHDGGLIRVGSMPP